MLGCGPSPVEVAAPPRPPQAPGTATEPKAEADPTAPSCGSSAAYADARWLDRPDGTRLWYRERGDADAPTVVYVHGGPGYNAFAFDRAVGEELARNTRLVLTDQRGCGRSAAATEAPLGMNATVDDLEALRKTVGASRWTLLAHSFGGLVAVEYARRYPEAVAGLVLVETTADLPDALEHQVATAAALAPEAWSQHAPGIAAIAGDDGSPMNRLLKIYGLVGPSALQGRLHWRDAAMQAKADAWDVDSGLLACSRPEVLSAYREGGWIDGAPASLAGPLRMPAILVGGRHSNVIGEENLERSAEGWGVPIVWMEHSGHFPYIEEPVVFTRAVTSFVARRPEP